MLKKIVLAVIAAILAFSIVIFALYFASGSLETMPTEDKIDQTREACAIIIFVLSVIEVLVIVNFVKAFKK